MVYTENGKILDVGAPEHLCVPFCDISSNTNERQPITYFDLFIGYKFFLYTGPEKHIYQTQVCLN